MDFETQILRRINNRKSFLVIEEDSMMEPIVKSRKRRLDHLTWEEKIQRKKLKNRVAAQTSRDKKKAKLERLEQDFSDLMEQNQRVLAECENLRNLNAKLREDNIELQLSLRQATCGYCKQAQSRPVECGDRPSGSAASDLLLQQGTVAHSAAALSTSSSMLLKILLACLFCRISSMSSTATPTWAASTSSRRAFSQISSPTLIRLAKALNCKSHLVDPVLLDKWWGRQQNSWNPVQVTLAA